MAIGTTTALIGGGLLGLGGAALSADAQRDAASQMADAARFNPFNVVGPGGSAIFDGNTLFNQTDSLLGQFRGALGEAGIRQLLGGPGESGVNAAQQFAGQALPGLFAGADTGLMQQFMQQQAGFGDFMNRQAALFGADPRQSAINVSGGAGVADNVANSAIQTGQGLLTGDSQSVIDDTLARLRQQARPGEERAVNSRVNQLFNRGILSSTAGARSLGELALTQENADISRQQLAEQAGLARFGANQQFGQGLLGLGQSGLLQGRQQNIGLGLGLGGLDLQNLNRMGNVSSGLFDANNLFANAIGAQGTNRLALAQQLFGFGQDTMAQNTNISTGLLQGLLGIDTNTRNIGALGGNIGGQQAAAGANVASAIGSMAGSPFGGLLSGFGQGFLDQALGGLVG